MSEFNAFFQSSCSVDCPARRTSSLTPDTSSSNTSYSGPNSASNRSFNQAATAGLWPPVETVINVPAHVSLRKVDLSIELQILSFYQQQAAGSLTAIADDGPASAVS